MRIRLLRQTGIVGKMHPAGSELDLSRLLALELVQSNKAEALEPDPGPAPEREDAEVPEGETTDAPKRRRGRRPRA